jgi:hypothetical protein
MKPNPKRTGELAEAAFLLKAETLGLRVSKPWGDSERYDFLLDSAGRLSRVQIKCTATVSAGGYEVQSTYCDKKAKGKYTAADVDFLVAYILPLDLWYIIPAAAFPASASLRFYPGRESRRPRFEHFREAWHLFQMDPQPVQPHSSSAPPTPGQPSTQSFGQEVAPPPLTQSPLLTRIQEVRRTMEERLLGRMTLEPTDHD